MAYEDKLKTYFPDSIVLKDPDRSRFFASMSYPSYMRDWLVMKFADETGAVDYSTIESFIKKNIPTRDDFPLLQFRLTQGETIKILARVRLSVNVRRQIVEFTLPDFGGKGVVAECVLEKWADQLLKESENWGIFELKLAEAEDAEYFQPTEEPQQEETSFFKRFFKAKEKEESAAPAVAEKPKKPKIRAGEVVVMSYKPFCPYKVDLDEYRAARANFTVEEWLDVLISAVDYNPHGYTDETGLESERQKLFFLRRLLPFVEKRINMIELAPKGTGKSYVYEKISKRGWLVSSGSISRASLFYDNSKHTGGLITRFDYVGFDETQSIEFTPQGEIQTGLKTYMEFGEVKGFDAQMPADAGIVVLGNVDASKFNLGANLVSELNPIFRESALMDRFHGLIPGWEIPRFKNDMIANGWALNTEYFAEVLHKLRDERIYAAIVDECLDIPKKADQRDLTAITRLCTAFLKLFFPHVQSKTDVDADEFIKYCLEPALAMRGAIRKQLHVIDPGEFSADLPDIKFKY